MLEIYFSELFSNINNPKACFQARKIRLPFFSYRSLLLSTSVLNDKQLINVDRIELKPSKVCKSWYIITASSFAFSAVASRFSQLLKCDTDMVASYCIVPYLQRCYASLDTSSAVHDY